MRVRRGHHHHRRRRRPPAPQLGDPMTRSSGTATDRQRARISSPRAPRRAPVGRAVLVRLFWSFFSSSSVRLALSLSFHGVSIFRLYSTGMPSIAAAPPRSLLALFIASRIACYLFYACALVGTQRLLHDARLYSRSGLKEIRAR